MGSAKLVHALSRWYQHLQGTRRRLIGPFQSRRRIPLARALCLKMTTSAFGSHDTVQLLLSAFAEAPKPILDDMWNSHVMWGGNLEGQYDYFDMAVLYGMTRIFNVNRVIEISPHKGWSTTVIQLALDEATALHLSFDIVDYERSVREQIRRYTLPKHWHFVLGDVKVTILEHLDALATADLVFIDSDHSQEFAHWYLEELRVFDRVGARTLVHIHDIYPIGMEPPGFGESPYVLGWLQARASDYDLLWNYELSRHSPVIDELPKTALLNHEYRQAPNCSLWALRKTH